MRWIRLSTLSLAFALPAAAAAETPDQEVSSQTRVDARGVRLPRPEAIEDNHVSKILYLNRCEGGCIIEPGSNDARYDTSSIVSETSSIPEFRHGDEVWNQVVQCVKEIYAPYDVEITDQDPGDQVFHHEAIVAGDYTDIDYPNPAGGVAPSQCVPANNVISFTFANGYGPDPIRICSVIAQESAHSYGLEHAFDCADPMTYLAPCGRQFFRDRVTPCGEFEQFERCSCGGTAQNSHRWLRMVLGENDTPIPGPEVNIAEPMDGAEVSDGFRVGVLAEHVRGIGRVDLFINGTEYGSLEGHEWPEQSDPYWFDAPDLPDGIMDLEVRAYNDIGSETVETITVTKGEPCSAAADCLEGQECDEGRCVWPPPTGQLGDPCESAEQCVSGLCPRSGEEAYCSETCIPGSKDVSCPSGFRCVETDINQGVCWPGSSGGCAAAGAGSWGGLLLVLFAGLFYVIPWRRRRPCTSSSPTSRQDS